jgi:heme/copper-type cytochrome/quinol oxidase subunit 2
MNENLLQNSPSKNSSSDSDFLLVKDESFYIIIGTLKHIHPRSKIKRNLAYILGTFYSCQTSFIFISLTIGVLILGIPLLLIYNNLIRNIAIPFLIIDIFSIIFSFILIMVHICDGKANKTGFLQKWERKNILKNIGTIFTLIILIISIGLIINFYSKIINYKDDEKIVIDISGSTMSKELTADFLFKYIINMAFLSPKDINSDNEDFNIKFYVKEDNDINILRTKLMSILIPLLIICFNKIIKCFIIEVKFTIAQMFFFFGSFFCCLLSIIISNYKLEDLINLNIDIISGFELFSIIIIYIGYISWILHSSFKLIRNPKDKNFSIRKYTIFNLILILLLDLITLIGASFIILSFIYFYLSVLNGEENLKNLKISFKILKFGFLLTIIGNSYYYGHYLLSMIFRPISIQYSPYELKNHNYIKAKRNLYNILVTKRKDLKLNDVIH